MTTFEENRDAGQEIARIGGSKAAGLVVGILAHNAERAARQDEEIRRWVEQERDEWRERALYAEAELAAVRASIRGLIYPSEERIQTYLS